MPHPHPQGHGEPWYDSGDPNDPDRYKPPAPVTLGDSFMGWLEYGNHWWLVGVALAALVIMLLWGSS